MATVRKRGSSYTVTVSMGYSETGKHHRKNTTFTPPEGVSDAKALKLANEFAILWESKIKGFVSLDENKTFRELSEWYYSNLAPSVLKESTLLSDKNLIEDYALPTIGNVKLKNITPHMLDGFFHELQINGATKQRYILKDPHALDGKKNWLTTKKGFSSAIGARLAKGQVAEKKTCERIAEALGVKFSDLFVDGVKSRALSPATVIRIRKCVTSILSAAVRKEIMTRNPASKTTPISSVAYEAKSFLDEEQSIILLNALNDCNLQFKTMITTLLFTGMRGGELCLNIPRERARAYA